MKVYVFPGQGSQFVGMGKELFGEFRDIVEKVDNVLGYSIEKLCLEPNDKLGLTQYTQPALYTVNALSYYAMLKQGIEKPDYVAGHSLGEYNALLAADVFDFETGLRLVKKRGELMSNASGGGMAAVIGLEEEEVRNILDSEHLDTIDMANLNSPYQIVISGPAEDILRAKNIFLKHKTVMYSILKVSGAFHSRYMKSAADEFKEYLDQFKFYDPKIKIISNYTARPYKSGKIKDNLYYQIFNGVRWTESICYLMGKKADDIIQVGPGRVVSGLVKKILLEGEPLYIEDESDEFKAEEDHVTESEEPIVQEQHTEKVISKEDISEAEVNNEILLNDEVKEGVKKIPDDLMDIAKSFGNSQFKRKYDLKYAYVTGGMHMGISSVDMVVKIAEFGGLGFYGTSGNSYETIENAIDNIKSKLNGRRNYGINMTYKIAYPDYEKNILEIAVKKDVPVIELSSYLSVTEEIVKYKARSLNTDRKIFVKVSRVDLAEAFMSPASEMILSMLFQKGEITADQREELRKIPIADDICVIGDCAGITDSKSILALYPAIVQKKQELISNGISAHDVCIGVGGGIGTGEAAAAAFAMGADFILTGSINQCTVEADTSESVKNILEKVSIDDLDYVKDGSMLDVGSQVQIVKRGGFFFARANNLARLYMSVSSLNDIPKNTIEKIEKDYFRKPFDLVYKEIAESVSNDIIEKAEKNPKYKMGLIFNYYYEKALIYAKQGKPEDRLDYQIYCGPALGAYNALIKDTMNYKWNKRRVDDIAFDLLRRAVMVQNKDVGVK